MRKMHQDNDELNPRRARICKTYNLNVVSGSTCKRFTERIPCHALQTFVRPFHGPIQETGKSKRDKFLTWMRPTPAVIRSPLVPCIVDMMHSKTAPVNHDPGNCRLDSDSS